MCKKGGLSGRDDVLFNNHAAERIPLLYHVKVNYSWFVLWDTWGQTSDSQCVVHVLSIILILMLILFDNGHYRFRCVQIKLPYNYIFIHWESTWLVLTQLMTLFPVRFFMSRDQPMWNIKFCGTGWSLQKFHTLWVRNTVLMEHEWIP